MSTRLQPHDEKSFWNYTIKLLYNDYCQIFSKGCVFHSDRYYLQPKTRQIWRCIYLVTDNCALVYIINRQMSKHKFIILLRELIHTSLNYNIPFWAGHIAGYNSRADLLSCFQVSQFKQIFPEAKWRHEYQTTFCRRVSCFPERSPFFSALHRVTKVVSSSLDCFPRFVSPQSFSLPLTMTTIALFESYLRAQKLAPPTISSYLSAISYVHKMNVPRYPTKIFLIQKLLAVIGRDRSPSLRQNRKLYLPLCF